MRLAPIAVAAGLLAAVSLGCGKKPGEGLRFAPSALADATTGKPYRAEIAVTNANTPVASMIVKNGALPPGIELHRDRAAQKDAAVLEGTPTAPGEYAFEIAAGCYGTNVSGQAGSQAYRIVVR